MFRFKKNEFEKRLDALEDTVDNLVEEQYLCEKNNK